MKPFFRISFVVILFIGFCLVGCRNNSTGKKTDYKSVYEKIIQTNTIEVGYINYPPGFIIDPNSGKYSGIFQEVLESIAQKNNLTIKYKEPVSWATMIQDVNLKKVDLIANPVWATEARRESADFSNPVYYSPIGVFVRFDDNRFKDNYSTINNSNINIAAVQGEVNNEIGKNDFPLANLDPFPDDVDVSQLFLEIRNGRKDVTFAEPMFAHDYMKKNPNTIKNIGLRNPIRNYPNCYMVKKDEPELMNFLNQNINELAKEGILDSILSKYVPFEGAVISITDSLAMEKQ